MNSFFSKYDSVATFFSQFVVFGKKPMATRRNEPTVKLERTNQHRSEEYQIQLLLKIESEVRYQQGLREHGVDVNTEALRTVLTMLKDARKSE